MRDEQCLGRIGGDTMAWAATPPEDCAIPVVLDSVDARAGGAARRRVFRGRLHNHSDTTAAVTLEVALPAPFLPSAPVLAQRLFTIAPGETLRVELGSTVGATPSTDEVRAAALLRVG